MGANVLGKAGVGEEQQEDRTVFIKPLADVGRPSPLRVAPFPRKGILNQGRVEKSSRARACIDFSLISMCGCDMTSCLKFLS